MRYNVELWHLRYLQGKGKLKWVRMADDMNKLILWTGLPIDIFITGQLTSTGSCIKIGIAVCLSE
jgi:hypothetical protein